MKYCDSRLDNLVPKHDLELIRMSIESLRKEVNESVGAMGLRVKFDLLHDETPQVGGRRSWRE